MFRSLTLITFLFSAAFTFAQDTEVKDVKENIIIHIKVQSDNIDCEDCAEKLKKELSEIESAHHIEVSYLKECACFEIYSAHYFPKEKLEEKLKKAGFVPKSIEYSKDPIEDEPLDGLEVQ